jgi:hypothetical protein
VIEIERSIDCISSQLTKGQSYQPCSSTTNLASATSRSALQYYQISPRRSHRVITCLKSYPPQTGELFYLRAVLQHHSGRSWNDLYTVANVQYTNFQAVAIALGLFPKDVEAHFAMTEAVDASYSPGQLRFLCEHLS